MTLYGHKRHSDPPFVSKQEKRRISFSPAVPLHPAIDGLHGCPGTVNVRFSQNQGQAPLSKLCSENLPEEKGGIMRGK